MMKKKLLSYRYFLVTVGVAAAAGHVLRNLMCLFLENPFQISSFPVSCVQNTVYIPGGGFSGFFYTLGRLSAMRNNKKSESPYEYYCFSSGCLALVTDLMGWNIDSAVQLAHGSRNQFINGNIGPYSVVETFVDGVLFGDPHLLKGGSDQCSTKKKGNTAQHQLHGHLSRINIITTSWNDANLPSLSIRRASSVDQLKQMLIQTTWIPFVTGSSWFEGDSHNDGGFAMLFGFKGLMENCHLLKLPWRMDLMSNFLNLFLSHENAVYFWEEGLKRGMINHIEPQ